MRFVCAFILIIIFALSPVKVYSQDFWGNLADLLNSIYGQDKNAGLTTFPVLNVPMGGRAEGMAGAFAAVADDISFIDYNPAGSSMLARTELAFFHNNWVADTNLEAIAYTTRFGNLGVGAGLKWLYTPFTEYNMYGQRVSNGYYSEGVVILNASYNFFSGYYFGGLSLGASLKGAFRIVPDFTDNSDNIISGSGMDQSSVMGMLDIGLLTRFNFLKFYNSRERNMAAAFVIRNLGPSSMGEPLPTVVNAAISYKPIRPVLFSFDFFLPVNLTDISLSELPYGALGISVQATNFLSMRTGLMVKAGTARFTIGSAVSLNNITFDFNYTLDLLTQFQPLDRISIGIRFDMGDRGRGLASNRVDQLYITGMEAYSQGRYEEAKLNWEEALTLDPGFTPAKEGILMIDNREDLIRRIEDLYILDF